MRTTDADRFVAYYTARYRALVDAMYDGRTEVRFEPGSGEEAAPADVKIRDAKVVASAQIRRAA